MGSGVALFGLETKGAGGELEEGISEQAMAGERGMAIVNE